MINLKLNEKGQLYAEIKGSETSTKAEICAVFTYLAQKYSEITGMTFDDAILSIVSSILQALEKMNEVTTDATENHQR